MSARDELADILHGKGAYCGSCGYEDGRCSDCKEVLTGYADAILAAGYRRPRTITTAEELDALPDGSVVLAEGVAYQHYASQVDLPATVLYEPEQP